MRHGDEMNKPYSNPMDSSTRSNGDDSGEMCSEVKSRFVRLDVLMRQSLDAL